MTLAKKTLKREGERGNALFLILIAVALFAALSYAITQSGRGGGNVSSQTAIITAGQLTEEPADIRAAVARMILSGSATPIAMTFTGAATAQDVFDQTGLGGGATNVPPPPGGCSPVCTTWTYVPIAGAASGSYVYGVGTAAPESLAYLPAVTQQVCIAINNGLALAMNTALLLSGNAQTGAAYTTTAGVYSAAAPTGSATTIANGAILSGQDFACWNNHVGGDNATYAYYASLLDQ